MKNGFKIICLNCNTESILSNSCSTTFDSIISLNDEIALNPSGGDYGSSYLEITCKKCGNIIGS